MDSKKERILARLLLPFLAAIIAVSLLASIIVLNERINELSITVQHQSGIIADLEVACGRRKDQENGKINSNAEREMSTNTANGLKKQGSSMPGDGSKVNLSKKLPVKRNVTRVEIQKDYGKELDPSKVSMQSQSSRNAFNSAFENDERQTMVKRSLGSTERCRSLCIGMKGQRGKRGKRGKFGQRGAKGEKGEKGDRGERGQRGEKGDRGFSGPRGNKGSSGKPGPAGNSGSHGQKGERGSPGYKGERGEMGPQGPTGERGFPGYIGARGEMGPQGPKGDTGKDGNPKTTELIHLVGNRHGRSSIVDMRAFSSRANARFVDWKTKDRFGKILYNDGYIHIKVTGYYYVYCQIHYSGKLQYNRHQVLRNNIDTLLLGLDTFKRGHGLFSSNSSTKFVGGVFLLAERDRISASGIGTQYTLLPHSSYFGVFLIHPLP